MSGTFSLKVMPRIVTVGLARPRCNKRAHAFARYPFAHAVIDAASGENDFRMIAGLFGAECQVVRVDADAVPADQPGLVGGHCMA